MIMREKEMQREEGRKRATDVQICGEREPKAKLSEDMGDGVRLCDFEIVR